MGLGKMKGKRQGTSHILIIITIIIIMMMMMI